MAKRRDSNKRLKEANKFLDLLLYDCSGGSIGIESEKPLSDKYTPGERNALCALAFKSVDSTLKNEDEGEEQTGLDLIRKKIDVSTTAWSGRNKGGSAEGAADLGVLDTTGKPEESES